MTDSLPQPRTTDPTSVPSLRWGVIGTGWIADQFVTTVTRNSHQRIVAVGSRSLDRAREFAEGHGVEKACGSYEELVAQDLDVIYVATGPTWTTPPTPGSPWRLGETCSSKNP